MKLIWKDFFLNQKKERKKKKKLLRDGVEGIWAFPSSIDTIKNSTELIYTVTTRTISALRWAVTRARLTFHHLWGAKSQDSVHKPQRLKRKQSGVGESNQRRPLTRGAYQPYRWAKPSHRRSVATYLFVSRDIVEGVPKGWLALHWSTRPVQWEGRTSLRLTVAGVLYKRAGTLYGGYNPWLKFIYRKCPGRRT